MRLDLFHYVEVESFGIFQMTITRFILSFITWFSLRFFHSQVEYEVKYVDTNFFLFFFQPIIKYSTLSINPALAKSLLSDRTINQVFLFCFHIFRNTTRYIETALNS